MYQKKNLFYIILLILLLLPLSSCFVAKKYEQPQLKTEGLFRTDHLINKTALVMDSTSMAEVSWKSLFFDTLLKNYITKALKNNIDIRIALQNINAAAAYVKKGKASLWPTVNGNLNYSYSKNPQNSQLGQIFNGSVNQYQLGASLSWEADIWGKIRSQQRANQAAYLQSIEAHKAVKTRLVANISTIYYRLTALDAQIKIAKSSILSRDSSLTTTKSLKMSGRLTAVAVKQTEAQLYAAKIILLNLKKQERTLENAFCMLLNEPPHNIPRNNLKAQEITTSLKIGVPSNLLANRPDVLQAEFALIEAFELTNVAKSSFYPSLTITATSGLQSIDIKNWLSLNSLFTNIAGGLLQPIVNHRKIQTAYDVAKSKQKQALLSYEQTLLLAGNEVSDALYDYQIQTQTIKLQEQQFKAYKTAVNYSEQLLKYGLSNYLEVLNARQNVLTTQLNLVDAKYQRLAAIVQLYKALGGGWQ